MKKMIIEQLLRNALKLIDSIKEEDARKMAEDVKYFIFREQARFDEF